MNAVNELDTIRKWLGKGSINIFGRPFSGKDTQAKILAEKLNGQVLGGGDIMRGSDMPPYIKELMKTGDLVPTEEYIRIVLPYLKKEEFADKPLILSAVGRWIGEEQGVIEAAQAAGHPIKAVIHLQLSESKVRSRLEAAASLGDRGDRDDDDASKIDIRLSEFKEKTLPVIEVYRHLGLLIEIDGDQTVEVINKAILLSLNNLASSRT